MKYLNGVDQSGCSLQRPGPASFFLTEAQPDRHG